MSDGSDCTHEPLFETMPLLKSSVQANTVDSQVERQNCQAYELAFAAKPLHARAPLDSLCARLLMCEDFVAIVRPCAENEIP
jgi:hypothetical protein